tara:strand:- start:70 stop:1314 length:1245 start_codon:yes stop_codon:yes gene_type:complete
MGIDNVAIKTFNSTGAQSVCRANEADSSKLIESQFLTKCTTEYINGSGMSLINGSTLAGSTTVAALPDTFYLPNDCDAISDVIYNGTKLSNISEIHVIIGQLTAQTIYPHDIISRNNTELGVAMSRDLTDKTFSIPFIGRAKNTINSFLQAGAMTNQMKIKVTYKKGTESYTDKTSICVFTHQITDTEKNFIAKNIVNRPVHTSHGLQTLQTVEGEKKVDLSSVNINVSHILIHDDTIALTSKSGTFLYTAADTTVTFNITNHGFSIGETVNIFGNTVVNGLHVVATRANDNTFTITSSVSANDITVPVSVSVSKAGLTNVELILGSDRTGSVPVKMLKTKLNAELFSLAGGDDNVYIIKTADSAFSTAGIPFARVNNKQLKLTTYNASGAKVYVTVCGTQVQTTVGGTISFSA